MRRPGWYRQAHWQILLGLAAGIVAGTLGGAAVAERVAWLGTLFITLLKMIVVPLVLASIISGVASLGGGLAVGRMFGRTFAYYVVSSLLAILTGLVLANLLRPGDGLDTGGLAGRALPELSTPSSLPDLLLGMVPENVVASAARADLLALIVFGILFGFAAGGLPEAPRDRVVGFFEALFQAMLRLTGFVLRLAPVGVFGLVTRAVAEFGLTAFRAMLLYMAMIVLGLAIHAGVTLPALLRVWGRVSPARHFRAITEPLTLAFSTSSSAATLPVTLAAVEGKVGVSRRVSSFVLPLGATINMDGTALYECAGVLFIAQAIGVDLTIGQQVVVVVTSLLASIGAAAIPSAGLVVIFIVLEAVGLRGPQVEAIVGFMLAVDRPLDMARTAVNVASDTCAAAIVARGEGELASPAASDARASDRG
ncbi:MAG: dicarboxylate/amino acid:cation symporter [Thermoanaerobaculia bacterium]|nr:dicarboxylate/amino acid:cation symporter [Thermoanaerobaculia bacterium]